MGEDFIFQQDNNPTHVSLTSLDRFITARVNLLDWPSRSPNLNPIENAWSMLSDIVYDGRQYNSKEEIWAAIDRAVTFLNTERKDALNSLLRSMLKRLLKCIERKGDLIDY